MGVPRGQLDDTRHPLLSRARPPAQVHIDALAAGAGRDHYGRVQVQEVEARSALTDFTQGGRTTGEAWSLNPYAGCQHQCSYCYVPDTIHAERWRWGTYVIAKTNLPTVLAREMRRKPRLTTYISTGTDPYQPVEEERRITRACLQVLARRDWPVDILTRGPLVTRDIDLLSRFSQIRVGLSIPTLDDDLRRLLEPAAPPIPARLAALRRLADAGLTVYANYCPAYPFTKDITPGDLAQTFREAGAQWANTSHWRYLESILAPVSSRLRETAYEDLVPFIADEARQRRRHRTLKVAFERAGVPLHTGFFNAPHAPDSAGPAQQAESQSPQSVK